jgi:hypothetical protein
LSSDVDSNAQRRNAQTKIGPDYLAGNRDNSDWLRDKALHIRLNRATVNGRVQKAERPLFVRYFDHCRTVSATRQRHTSAFTGERASVGGWQRHGANDRGARTDACDGRRRSERGEYRCDKECEQWPHVTPLL